MALEPGGMAATKRHGPRVIPPTLAMVLLLNLIPDGKRAPLFPDLGKDQAAYRPTLAELLDLLASGAIRPVVADRVALAGAARAHERLEQGGVAGKLVLVTESAGVMPS
jgi:NADPH2:quinone reductase